MGIDRECQRVRELTNSDITNEMIFRDIMLTDRADKIQLSSRIETLLVKCNKPIEKAFYAIGDELSLIANEYNIDIASMLWIYMDLRKEKEYDSVISSTLQYA